MVVPPFRAREFLTEHPDLADEKGYLRVRDTYQTDKVRRHHAVGVAVAVDVPWQTPTPVGGIPKTGFPTEQMAHTAAANIAAQIRGEVPMAARSSATSRPCASWTPATTASSSWPTRCCPRASTVC